MNTYRFKAVTAEGKVVHGTMQASGERAVIEHLRASGHLPISAQPALPQLPYLPGLRFLRRGDRQVKRQDVTALTRELSTLLEAGIPLDASLRTLERHCHNPVLKPVIVDTQAAVRSGTPLSSAFARHANCFDSLYVSLVRAGEAAGAVAATLRRIADYRERMEAFRASIIGSLIYPLILIAVAVISLFVLTGFVVPRFVPLFAESDTALPLLTRIVFSASLIVKHTWWILVIVACGGALYFERWYALPANRRRVDAWLLTVPVLGELLCYADTARISRTLGSLLSSGVPLADGLRLSAPVGRNAVFREALDRCRTNVEHGGRLAQALGASGVFPSLAHELIAIGEESGQLEDMLHRTAETFESRVQSSLKRLLVLIEPVTILGLGGAIALVIVAVLMAMLKLNALVA